MSPHAVRGTGTRHTVETVERGRERGWEGNCFGYELPLQNRRQRKKKRLLRVCQATIHERMEFQPIRMCVDTADYWGNASALCC